MQLNCQICKFLVAESIIIQQAKSVEQYFVYVPIVITYMYIFVQKRTENLQELKKKKNRPKYMDAKEQLPNH